MTAEIVAVGTEVLLGDITDTNSAELGRKLAEFGVLHFHRQTVGDNVGRLTDALTLALSRSDIVFTIGGLGPTTDDLTRDGIAAALGDELVYDDSVEQDIRAKLKKRNIEFLENQKLQCYRPSCANPIDNPNGTAPGLLCTRGDKTLIAMPGPKREFVPMLEGPVSAFLKSLGLGVIHARVVRMVGIPESQVQEQLGDLMSLENPSVAPYVKSGEVHVRIRARASSVAEAEKAIAPIFDQINARLQEYVYAFDDESLEESILQTLRARKETLAVAESCTGGGLGERITTIPGSSDVFLGGVISYSNELKQSLLGVTPQTLKEHGAVSEQCAREMAEGAKRVTGATWALSITGVAGPGGGTEEKPVGLVYIALAGPQGTCVLRNNFIGDRANVRERSELTALALLRRVLADEK